MYSAELDEASIKAARQVAPPPLKKDIARLQRQWRAMRQGRPDYSALPEPPAALLTTMAQTSAAIGAWQAEHPSQVIAPLQRLWFDLLAFIAALSNPGAAQPGRPDCARPGHPVRAGGAERAQRAAHAAVLAQ